MTRPLVLVIEDEAKIAGLLRDVLEHSGYSVEALDEGTQAVELIQRLQPACVLLDLMLPGKDGLSICSEVRRFSDVPILMLTARVDEIDRLLGLEIGADDYICKPFSPREVVARVRAILRRVRPQPVDDEAGQSCRLGALYLSLERYQCQVQGQDVELTPVELRLLWALISHPGRVLSRERLMRLSYTDDRIVSERTMDTHVKNLRRKLASSGPPGFQIRAIYGVGYKIELDELSSPGADQRSDRAPF